MYPTTTCGASERGHLIHTRLLPEQLEGSDDQVRVVQWDVLMSDQAQTKWQQKVAHGLDM